MTDRNLLRAQLLIEAADLLDEAPERDEISRNYMKDATRKMPSRYDEIMRMKNEQRAYDPSMLKMRKEMMKEYADRKSGIHQIGSKLPSHLL